MSQPIAVDNLSDDDDAVNSADYFSVNQNDTVDLSTPLAIPSKKKQKIEESSTKLKPPVLIIDDDDDPTPFKPSKSTPLFVADTPLSDFSKPEVSFVKCSFGSSSILNPKFSGLDLTPSMVAETPASELSKYSVPIVRCTKAITVSQNCSSSTLDHKNDGGIDGLICLESDNESEDSGKLVSWNEEEKVCSTKAIVKETELSSRPFKSTISLGYTTETKNCRTVNDNFMLTAEDVSHRYLVEAGPSLDHGHPDDESDILELNDDISRPRGKGKGKKSNRSSVDEVTGKTRMSKDERFRLNEEKKQQKEREKLQKAAQKAEAAEIKKREKEKEKWEKGKFALKSIVAHIDTKVVELGSIGGHLLSRLAEKGLSFRVSSNPIEKSIVWSMSVPEEISKISSEVIKVPYILIICEAEEFCDLVNSESLMSHVSRVQRLYPLHTVCYLTNKLMAYINKRNKLTRLSVNANGSLIPKSCVDKDMIKKSPWLKALVAIPKVQPRFAIAIWKKYPTMKSLLHVYMDPSKSVHEKEFLLKDLKVENMLGDDRKLGEICSRRVYRILMAQSGSIKTDDIEKGADFFS
ncbi:crossover junction endonuclease EME1B-like isoform X3 [Nicotiana tomentosiformis]|uniref:crossover junction endonuclease EME1B-like isoform X3 n=1 Tax=Nicotiana tomentosiformis TaxID=4098 RepID=UPI00051B68B5|nr:crossover junction endonuclease EME1B-like isoform X4 [Nicotiana tomentosiformis]